MEIKTYDLENKERINEIIYDKALTVQERIIYLKIMGYKVIEREVLCLFDYLSFTYKQKGSMFYQVTKAKKIDGKMIAAFIVLKSNTI